MKLMSKKSGAFVDCYQEKHSIGTAMVYVLSHTAVLVIQNGETALDRERENMTK